MNVGPQALGKSGSKLSRVLRSSGWRIALICVVLAFATADAVQGAETTVYINRYFEVREHDQPVKYAYAGETRIARVTGSLSPVPRVQRFRLHPGWNLRSVAVSGAVLPSGADSVTASYRWNQAGRNWLPVSSNETLAAGAVLWLHATNHTAFGLKGAYAAPTNRPVSVGGSFLAGASLESLPLPASGADFWFHDASLQSWSSRAPGLPESEPQQVLVSGDSAFVNSDEPFELAPEIALSVRYYHPDHLGSSSAVTDAEGALVEETAFFPFGVPRHSHRPRQIQESYGYTQKERDGESGLQYYGARYLVTRLGRFASVDPKYVSPDLLRSRGSAASKGPSFHESPQLQNLYAMTAGNPLKFTDPDGREVVWSEAIRKDKAFQKAFKILESTQEGKRVIAALESANVSVDVGKLKGDHGIDEAGHHHGRAEITGPRRSKTRQATSVITIDLAKSKKLKQTPEELANVLHHELRHAEIHNTVASGEDYTSDEGISRAEAPRNKAHKKLDVYLPYNGAFKGRKGTGVQSLDDRSVDFQKEVGLLPSDYGQDQAAGAQATK